MEGCYLSKNALYALLININMEYTLAYSESVKGWTSFYSYMPEVMIGMNSHLYSFKNGNLYQHSVNDNRNNFYGVDYPSTITAVIN